MIDRRARRNGAKTSILLADDQVMFREGLCKLLEASGHVHVLGTAGDGRQALDLVRDLKPQVAVLETALPALNGLELTRLIRRDHSQVRVILLTGSSGVDFAPQALKAGAAGLVLKRGDVIELLLAIRCVARGDTYFSSSLSGSILSSYVQMMEESNDRHGLTDREREVLQLIAEGYGNQDIAAACFISVKTVEAHKTNIMKKLSLKTRNELLMYAVRQGMAESAAE
ncbi:MAG TPA: response regulator transcription factor [Chloroflexota bacterium]|nr:response regulator transcription factor [Chloroflexota bacterium]